MSYDIERVEGRQLLFAAACYLAGGLVLAVVLGGLGAILGFMLGVLP